MYYVYVIKSSQDGKLYYGSTRDLRRRLAEHNAGKVYSTKNRVPFKLIYYEAYRAEHDARQREQKLKNYGRGTTELNKRIAASLAAD